MRHCTSKFPADFLGAPRAPSSLQLTAHVARQTTATMPAMASSIAWGCCPRHLSPASPSRHCMSWDSRRWRRNPRLAVLEETAESGSDLPSGMTESSGSSSSAADSSRLQPKPQPKYRRLTVGGLEGASSKPRRWHKASYPASPQVVAGSVLIPPFVQPSAAQPGPSGKISPASYRNANTSDSSGHESRTRELRGHGGRRSEQQQQRNPTGRRQQQQQQQQQQRGKPPGGAQSDRTVSVRNSGRRTEVYDEEAEDEEEDDGELLGLSEEELEAMVFASAGGMVESAPAGANQRRRSGNGGEGNGAAGTDSRPSAADAITAAALPNELAALLLAAVRSGNVSSDGDIITDQLQQLQKIAVAVANSTMDGGDASGGGDADADANALLVASVASVADLLDCSAEAAAVVLVSYPRYVSMLACGRSGCGSGEGLERLRSFAGMLKLELAEARDIVRRNPALLLAPYEPLRAKLTALANATGLSMAQATAMVTTYMFPEL
ncbi:hypothetical protein VaNZ11_001636 [Volvox africanus]|uniref:Uncharacterized protein n=1 Tax=Volvox africanus TaxID=51714 RepID=A0ABQ5RRG1_9CHLO|nr:hypothetical protein VaNZ11_001636 [Volvox africanus]